MTTTHVSLAVVMGALITALYLGRKFLGGLEALLLSLIPVILALGKVREAWKQVRGRAQEQKPEEVE